LLRTLPALDPTLAVIPLKCAGPDARLVANDLRALARRMCPLWFHVENNVLKTLVVRQFNQHRRSREFGQIEQLWHLLRRWTALAIPDSLGAFAHHLSPKPGAQPPLQPTGAAGSASSMPPAWTEPSKQLVFRVLVELARAAALSHTIAVRCERTMVLFTRTLAEATFVPFRLIVTATLARLRVLLPVMINYLASAYASVFPFLASQAPASIVPPRRASPGECTWSTACVHPRWRALPHHLSEAVPFLCLDASPVQLSLPALAPALDVDMLVEDPVPPPTSKPETVNQSRTAATIESGPSTDRKGKDKKKPRRPRSEMDDIFSSLN
jgi:hypothetical protein